MEDKASFFEMILNRMAISTFVLDRNGKMLFANDTFWKELDPDFDYNTDFAADAREGRLERSITQMVYETKREITMTNTYCRKNGETTRLLGTTTPILDENGEVEYIVSVGMLLDKLRDEYVNAWLEDNARKLGCEETVQLPDTQPLLYRSKSMEKVMELTKRIAGTDAAVCITGESGTGKGALTRYLHSISARRERDLVEVNCAAVPEALLESELFGYEKGAFTGALRCGKLGLMEIANGGTLFLDEIDSLPLSLQGKLLKALEDKKIPRIGALKPTPVDFRLITATNTDLLVAVKEGTFRKDLYYRICVLPLHIPPLRERPEDILLLSEHFISRFSKQYDIPKVLSPEGYRSLLTQLWPGNVRELKNAIERMILMSDDTVVEISQMPETVFEVDLSLKGAVEAYEKQLLAQVLGQYGLKKAADILKTDPSTITRKRIKYGI